MTEQDIQKVDVWIRSIITRQRTLPGINGNILKHILPRRDRSLPYIAGV